jgi:hypothetical protein
MSQLPSVLHSAAVAATPSISLVPLALFPGAAKQNDPEQERNNEWDCRYSRNEPGIGVPRRGESFRIRKVQAANDEQQQHDQTNDRERARGAASDPLRLPEGDGKRSCRNVSQRAGQEQN